jgi:hypothetical protein
MTPRSFRLPPCQPVKNIKVNQVRPIFHLFCLVVAGGAGRLHGQLASSGISKPWISAPAAPLAGEGLAEEGGRFLEGLSLGLGSTWSYDSNVNQANGRDLRVESDWILSLAPTVSWQTTVRDFTLRLNGAANYDHYAALDDYSGLDYQAGAALGYRGGPLALEGSVSYGSTQGVDRYAGGLTENRSLALNLKARYDLSLKTSFDASFSTNDATVIRQAGTEADRETSRTEFQLGALWQATPLVRLGPGLRSTLGATDTDGDRTTVGPMLRADYQLGGKIDFTSRIGLDFVEVDGGGSDQFTSAAIGLHYRLDGLRTLRFDLSRDVQPDTAIGGGFRESTRWRVGVIRKILTAQLDLGFGFDSSEFSGGSGPAARAATDYLTFDAGLGLPVLGERALARLFLRYQDNTSDDPRADWDGFQSGLSFSYNF